MALTAHHRRTKSLASALRSVPLAVALLLTGCAAQPLAAAPATTDSRTAMPTPQLKIWPPAAPVPTLSAKQTRGLESAPWRLIAARGDKLTIGYIAQAGCDEGSGIRIHETADSVELWTTLNHPKGDPACISNLNLGTTTITLRQPLASRQLLHAPVAGTLQVYAYRY